MQQIKFNQAVELQDENRGTHNATRYESGQVLKCSESSARHWISRGKAEPFVQKPEPEKRGPGRPPKEK